MIFWGQNIAAFKIPIHVDLIKLREEMKKILPLMMIHNMHVGGLHWKTVALRSPYGRFEHNDAAFFRFLPEIQSVSARSDREKRVEYLKMWDWTEVCPHIPYTMELLEQVQSFGSFLTSVRFVELEGDSEIEWHSDNVPGKEFRISIGIDGMDQEFFEIDTGRGIQRIDAKAGEAWFIDIALKHRVVNRSLQPRRRLALQFYSPTSDRLLELYKATPAENIIYARDYDFNPPFLAWD